MSLTLFGVFLTPFARLSSNPFSVVQFILFIDATFSQRISRTSVSFFCFLVALVPLILNLFRAFWMALTPNSIVAPTSFPSLVGVFVRHDAVYMRV